MPRIDPLQLLKCLSVLLAPNGGIKSKEEVQRLASLMTKFSKKLVSKCIYIQILKTTKTDLLGMFMAAGGWNLIHMWLSDGIIAKNWPLIQELLELLLMCPVDVERLKTNTCPKLIKGLSKDGSNENVRLLAGKLVEQWLRIVKGECSEAKSVPAADVKPVVSDVNSTISEVKPSVSETIQVVPELKTSVQEIKPVIPEVKPLTCEVKPTSSICEEAPVPAERVVCDEVRPSSVEQSEVVVKQEEVNDETTEQSVEGESVKLEPALETVSIKTEGTSIKLEKVAQVEEGTDNMGTWNGPVGQLPVYKITIRDGKQVLAKVYSGERTKKSSEEIDTTETTVKPLVKNNSVNIVCKLSDAPEAESEQVKEETEVKTEDLKVGVGVKVKVKSENVPNESIKSKEVHKKVKDTVTSGKVGDKKVKSSDLVKDKTKEKEVLKDKTKEKLKDKDKLKDKCKEKEKNREKENKEKKSNDSTNTDKEISQADRDKATLAKLIPPTISKLGKIPKKPKTDDSNQKNESKSPLNEGKKSPDSPKKPVTDPKKNSISIEVRNKDLSRPKTVKKFNSKFRSTGLEEEVKPPPSRVPKKPLPIPEKKPMKLPSLKRPSPPREGGPSEKKMKIPDVSLEDLKKTEKPGSIKLIPSKPKPPFLQESFLFSDALIASSKKEPRKRKRRISTSKDSDKKETGNKEDTTPPSSPGNDEIKSPPIVKPALKFYQDTMEAEDDKESDESKDTEKKEENEGSTPKEESEGRSVTPTPEGEDDSGDSGDSETKKRKLSSEEASDTISTENESTEERPSGIPKGVLVYHKTRKGPKKVVRWKPEKDLETIKYFELDETERVNVTKNFMDMKQIERSHEREALLSRKMPQDDGAEEDGSWMPLIPIDCPPPLAELGKNSREKDVQYAREKVILQAIYFNRSMIPDCPEDPDMEIHATTDPFLIPLDDATGNTDSVNDFTNTPWPDPKPMIIPQSPPPQYPLPQQPPLQQSQQTPQSQQQVSCPSPPFYGSQSFTPTPIFPNQQGMPNAVTNTMGVMMATAVGGGSGDWRTGEGKVVTMGEMSGPMDMYNQGAMPVAGMSMNMNMNMNVNMGMNMNMNMGMGMGMAMPSTMPGDMNYNMMGAGDDMGSGGPYPPQNFAMGGPPNMYGYQNSRGPGPVPGPNMGPALRGRGGRGGRGQWFNNQQGGSRWQGTSGTSGRGRGWSSRTVCKHFRGGYCRMQEKCPFLHPGVNGPPQY